MKYSLLAVTALFAVSGFAVPSPNALPEDLGLAKRGGKGGKDCDSYYDEYEMCKKDEYKYKK